MLQAVLEQPEKVVFREVKRPLPGKNEVLIRVKRIGICGSDIHAYYGKHPYISCPVVQGHEISGQVVQTGEAVTNVKVADNVTIMPQVVCGMCYQCTHDKYHICSNLKVIGCQVEGAASEYFTVNRELVVKLPDNMSYDFGAMVEPAAVGVHAVGKLGNVKGMNLLVIGAGPIGNLTAQAARALGARAVMSTDLSSYRLNIAKKCGIDYTVNLSKTDLKPEILKYFGDACADAVLECVGIEDTIEQAVNVSRKGTDIVVAGVFNKKPVVDIGIVQDRELRLIGTLMYNDEDYYTAIELIQSGKIVLEPLISTSFPFMKYGEAYRYIEESRDKSLKVIINMES